MCTIYFNTHNSYGTARKRKLSTVSLERMRSHKAKRGSYKRPTCQFDQLVGSSSSHRRLSEAVTDHRLHHNCTLAQCARKDIDYHLCNPDSVDKSLMTTVTTQ